MTAASSSSSTNTSSRLLTKTGSRATSSAAPSSPPPSCASSPRTRARSSVSACTYMDEDRYCAACWLQHLAAPPFPSSAAPQLFPQVSSMTSTYDVLNFGLGNLVHLWNACRDKGLLYFVIRRLKKKKMHRAAEVSQVPKGRRRKPEIVVD
ncbi:hypothetical protein EJB05_37318, partial [Eragrostis curvula]